MSKYILQVCMLSCLGGFFLGCQQDSRCSTESLAALQSPRYAVVSSDYIESAIAILDNEGNLLDEAWVHASMAEFNLIPALSGDVVLPSIMPANEIVVIDRLGVDVVSRFSINPPELIGQHPAQKDRANSSSAFRSNPHDFFKIDEHFALLSRHEPNTAPDVSEENLGNDVIVLDLESKEIAERISFDSLNETHKDKLVFARPSRVVPVGPGYLVGLVGLSLDFRVAAPGKVAWIRASDHILQSIGLTGLSNCGEVVRGQGEDQAWVLCAGQTFGDDDTRRAQSGIAQLTYTDGALRIEKLWASAAHSEAPVPSHGLISLSDTTLLYIARGENQLPDRLVLLDVDKQHTQVIYESQDSFQLQAGAWDEQSRALFLAHGVQGVLRLVLDADFHPKESNFIDVSPCRRLPARALVALAE